MFWASYIESPGDGAIYFKGRLANEKGSSKWIRAISSQHGIESTHPPADASFSPQFAKDFPLTLVNHRSPYVYVEPWYYGLTHGKAFVQMFRLRDGIWFSQSPTGAGAGNPAWDFQWFIPDAKVGQAYGFVMRAACLPFDTREQLEGKTRPHLEALNPSTATIKRDSLQNGPVSDTNFQQ